MATPRRAARSGARRPAARKRAKPTSGVSFDTARRLALVLPEYTTEHYHGYPTVLVRLSAVRAAELGDVIEQAWRRAAPARLVASFDAGGKV